MPSLFFKVKFKFRSVCLKEIEIKREFISSEPKVDQTCLVSTKTNANVAVYYNSTVKVR